MIYVLTSSTSRSACEGYFTYMYLITWLVTHLVGYNTSHLIEPCTYYVLASPTRQPVCEGYFTYLVPQLVNYLTYLLAWLVSYRTYLLTQLVSYLHDRVLYYDLHVLYVLTSSSMQAASKFTYLIPWLVTLLNYSLGLSVTAPTLTHLVTQLVTYKYPVLTVLFTYFVYQAASMREGYLTYFLPQLVSYLTY